MLTTYYHFRYIVYFFIILAIGCTPAEESEAAKNPPNILFCIADDASYPHMGAYGTSWVSTPGFDRVAQEGLLFNRAYTPNAKCAPSRSCIITGRNSWQLEEAANHWPYFPQKFTTYPEVLAQVGYATGFTGKGWAPGKAFNKDSTRRELLGPRYSDISLTPPAEHISPIDYAANFEAFLDSLPDNQPFCFWYGGLEPHRRYEYGAGINKGGKSLSDIDAVPAYWPDNDSVRTDMLDYAYEIAYFDQHLQQMLATLESRGMLENTLVVVTADNGMPFPRVKGQKYEYSNHLPLAMMWQAGIDQAGRTIDHGVSFIDFAPTFLEIAGVEIDQNSMQPIQGRSLVPVFSNLEEGAIFDRDYILIGKERHDVGRPDDVGYPVRGIFQDQWLYLHNFEPDRWPAGNPETGYLNVDGSPTKTVCLNARSNPATFKFWEWSFGKKPQEELYQIVDDPVCINNLAGEAAYDSVRKALKEQLFAELTKQEDPRMMGNGEVFDTYIYSNEADRNFYERYMNGEDVNAGWVNPTDFQQLNDAKP